MAVSALKVGENLLSCLTYGMVDRSTCYESLPPTYGVLLYSNPYRSADYVGGVSATIPRSPTAETKRISKK